MSEITLNTPEMEWQEAGEYPEGTGKKVLSDGSDMTPRTILLKLPPGWRMESHSHRWTEQHFVLEGEYESGGVTYPAGTFRVIPSGTNHGPFTATAWTVVMVSWCEFRT
jgi:anti-sigma factor ChrR (cupin superfamily)